jgi:glutamate:Na+ symporter, ESS family
VLELDAVQTLAFGGLALLLGAGVCRVLPILSRYNIPIPVIGGLIVAVAIVIARNHDITLVKFDTSLQSPLMIAFFTTVGFSASPALLRAGGPQVIWFLVIASIFAVMQNLVGAAVATAFGLSPLFGVLSGSVTLTGGPATGLAFAPLFEEAGVRGAATIAVAAAMAGIVSGGLLGGPIATVIIERYKLRQLRGSAEPVVVPSPEAIAEAHAPEPNARAPAGEDADIHIALRSLIAILTAMWIGSWISKGVAALGVTLPPYVGAMIVGSAIRTLDDYTGWLGLSQKTIDVFGAVCLSLFLAVALMTLKLWELSGLALPLLANLLVQVALVALVCGIVFKLMGRDYESAVMSGGFVGFMLGTTANAMAVMRALVERYGPAPRAFLVAPIVGAFFIDFTNALIITTFVNLWR